jgi:hypothetical protein
MRSIRERATAPTPASPASRGQARVQASTVGVAAAGWALFIPFSIPFSFYSIRQLLEQSVQFA